MSRERHFRVTSALCPTHGERIENPVVIVVNDAEGDKRASERIFKESDLRHGIGCDACRLAGNPAQKLLLATERVQ